MHVEVVPCFVRCSHVQPCQLRRHGEILSAQRGMGLATPSLPSCMEIASIGTCSAPLSCDDDWVCLWEARHLLRKRCVPAQPTGAGVLDGTHSRAEPTCGDEAGYLPALGDGRRLQLSVLWPTRRSWFESGRSFCSFLAKLVSRLRTCVLALAHELRLRVRLPPGQSKESL